MYCNTLTPQITGKCSARNVLDTCTVVLLRLVALKYKPTRKYIKIEYSNNILSSGVARQF